MPNEALAEKLKLEVRGGMFILSPVFCKLKRMKKRLLISCSGGRTSGYMTWWLLNEWKERDEYDIEIVFANTGKEHEGTLEFIKKCSYEWGIKIIWVEAVPKQSVKGGWWGVGHRIVDFDSASRKGEPFEEMISKLGIPSSSVPFCSDQLKRKAIESYLKSIGWNDFHKAIGIRANEIDRMNPNFRELKIMYPLIRENPVNTKMVNDWWKKQPFNLDIPKDLGNCDCCWKKDAKRLVRIAKQHPERYGWWEEMENKYGQLNPRETELLPPFNFYRGNMSVKDIFKLMEMDKRQLRLFSDEMKLDGCSESCEPF